MGSAMENNDLPTNWVCYGKCHLQRDEVGVDELCVGAKIQLRHASGTLQRERHRRAGLTVSSRRDHSAECTKDRRVVLVRLQHSQDPRVSQLHTADVLLCCFGRSTARLHVSFSYMQSATVLLRTLMVSTYRLPSAALHHP